MAVATSVPPLSPGYVFLAPTSGPGRYGPLIVDDDGEPVWFQPVSGALVHDFRVQRLSEARGSSPGRRRRRRTV